MLDRPPSLNPLLVPPSPPFFLISASAAAACAALAVLWPQLLAALAWTLLTIAFSAATVTRLFTAAATFRPEPESPPLADRDLPVYTIVVALYRDRTLWARLSVNGLGNVRSHFSFEAAEKAVRRIFRL